MLLTRPANRLKGWITIGGSPGERGENEGGTHVFINESGKITAGPAALMGKPINRLDQGKLKPGEKPKPPKPPKKPKPEKPPKAPETGPPETFEIPEDYGIEEPSLAAEPKPVERPEAAEGVAASEGFPTDPSRLNKVQSLGGSTGAELVEDPSTGKKYVRKKGASPEHLRSEAATDAAYRALGVPVVNFKIYNTPQGPTKLTEYLDGSESLAELPPGIQASAEAKLRKHFVADALLGNWDVVGLKEDNVRVGADGEVYRINNGGALSYRAQGAKKPGSAWGPEVTELNTLRDPKVNPQAAKVFGSVTDADIRAQVKDILSKSKVLLAALPPEDAKVIGQRLDWLEERYGPDVPVSGPKPTAEAPSAKPDYVGKPIGKGTNTPPAMDAFGKKHIAKLTVEQRKAIRRYTSTGYIKLNGAMRKCPPDFKCVKGPTKELMKAINEAVSVRLPEPVTVYRGLKIKKKELDKFLSSMKAELNGGEDEPYQMPCITSTSFRANTMFMESANVAFHIRARTGLPVESITNVPGEEELIQASNAKYRLVGMSETVVNGNKKHVIYMEEEEWLPQTSKALKSVKISSWETTSGSEHFLKGIASSGTRESGSRSVVQRQSCLTSLRAKRATNGPVAAGLAVVANDTGRVLMIQRPLKDGDPNGGKWEFPGGKIDDGESPIQTAFREWEEEVGLESPGYSRSNGPKEWRSSNGKYVGYVLHMLDGEGSLDLNSRDLFSDPDSEVGGVIAWVHPRDLPNHNLRPALLSDVDEVLAKVTKWLLTRQVRKGSRRYVRLTFRAATESGKGKQRTVWAEKLSDRTYKRVTSEGEDTSEYIVVDRTDVIDERQAKINLHYGELEVKSLGVRKSSRKYPTVTDIVARIRNLQDGEAVEIEGVNIWKTLGSWWVQAGGGVQYSNSPESAARKARALMPSAEETKSARHLCQCGRPSVLDRTRESIEEYGDKDVPHCPKCGTPCSWCECPDLPNVEKSAGPVNRLKASFFETCDRDEEGRCLPSGESGTATPSSGDGVAGEPGTPPPPGRAYSPDVEADSNGDGVSDSARVGVPAFAVPPPPEVGRLPNLTKFERSVESAFMDAFHADPDGVADAFRSLVVKGTKEGEPPTYGTDDAKALTNVWSKPKNKDKRSANRATLNLALHQTANAIAKRAFLKHLDALQEGDQVMVTVGGCGAGKGYALKNVPQAMEMKYQSKAVWDSAGDQNATENPWIQSEAEKRGLKVNYVYVHADPESQWAHPERGVVKRAGDPSDGRMVDADVFADSYALGAKNHQAFYERNRDNPNASFVFLENRGKPTLLDGIPKDALNLNRKKLAEFARSTVQEMEGVPPHVKRGATLGVRVWGEQP